MFHTEKYFSAYKGVQFCTCAHVVVSNCHLYKLASLSNFVMWYTSDRSCIFPVITYIHSPLTCQTISAICMCLTPLLSQPVKVLLPNTSTITQIILSCTPLTLPKDLSLCYLRGVDNFIEVGGGGRTSSYVSGHTYFMTLRVTKMHHDSMPLLIIGLLTKL